MRFAGFCGLVFIIQQMLSGMGVYDFVQAKTNFAAFLRSIRLSRSCTVTQAMFFAGVAPKARQGGLNLCRLRTNDPRPAWMSRVGALDSGGGYHFLSSTVAPEKSSASTLEFRPFRWASIAGIS